MNKTDSFGKKVLWNTVGSLVYLAATWFMTVAVVIFSDDFYASGQLAIAMAVGNVFSTVMLFRVRAVQVSDINDAVSAVEYIVFRIITGICALCFIAFYSYLTVDPIDYNVVAAYVLFKAGESFVDVLHGVFQKVGRFDIIGMSQLLRGILVAICFPICLRVTGSLLAAIIFVAVATILAIYAYDFRRSRPYLSKVNSKEIKLDNLARLVAVCFPGFVSLMATTLVVSAVRQRFGVLYGSDMLGLYASLAAPTVIVQALASYVYAPMLVPMATSWSACQLTAIKKSIVKFTLVLLLFTVITICAGSAIGEKVYLIVYGRDILSDVRSLYYLLACTSLTALLSFLQDIVVIIRRQIYLLVQSVLSLIIAILTMDFMFCRFSMDGISITIILAYSCGVIILMFVIGLTFRFRRKGGLHQVD